MTSESPAAVEVRGLTKRFLGTLALDRVDLTINHGEIHALVGENGAGKSTLIKILAGVYEPDEGEIFLHGKRVRPSIEQVPISFVHQDLGLVDELSIGENVAMVAGFPRSYGLISWKRVWAQAEDIYAGMGVDPPDPGAPVSTLSAASKAVLGIVRALSRKARIVVLDEPTASLPGPDAQHLFASLKQLKGVGASVLYVSHRLDELFGLVDRVSVFRDGRHVRSSPIDQLTPNAVVRDMLGHDLEMQHASPPRTRAARPLLQAEGLQTAADAPLSFSLAAGERLGVVGLRGAGHEAIGRAIFGATPQLAGVIRLDGEEIPPHASIAQRISLGIALLAGDRLRESALSGMSLLENLFPNAAQASNGLFRRIRRERERNEGMKLLERFDVRPRNPSALIDWLSGGNQQKVFVGRWLTTNAKLYIVEDPTAGVDIGAKDVIHNILRELAATGAAVLVVSSDFEEVASLCDRALVVARGGVVAELSGPALTVNALTARSSLGAPPAALVN